MKVKIFGNSVASAYLAARLAESANEVEWYTTGLPMQLRPIRMRRRAIALVRGQLQRQGLSAAPFMSAPEFRSSRNFFIKGKNSDQRFFTGAGGRWVDANALMRTLRKLVKDLGVEVHDVSYLDVPLAEQGSNVLLIVDSSARQFAPPISNDEEDLLGSSWTERISEYGTEYWLPQGRTKSVSEMNFFLAGHTQVVFEPHPEGGYALTFLGSTESDVKRAYRVVAESELEALLPLRALIHLNHQSYRQREFLHEKGAFHFSRPGVVPIGASIGSYPSFPNLEDDEFVQQAERLVEALSSLSDGDKLASMEKFIAEWTRSETAVFKKNFKFLNAWESLYSVLPRSRILQSATNLLPHKVRELMRSPF